MSLVSRLLERAAHLPPARTRDVVVRRNLEIPMPDGVTLLADRYRARRDGTEPVILMRSPYGRGSVWGLAARAFAERGFQVVVQSCRGTFGSGGVFNAYRDEAADGLATLDWLEAQPWSRGGVAMFGPSYLGIVQWAVAADPHATLRALAPAITSSRTRTFTYPAGSFSLASTLAWLDILAAQKRTGVRQLTDRLTSARRLARGSATTPLADADTTVTGERVRFYQDWLERKDDDAFWAPVEFDRHLDAVSVPVTMVTGWYDIFLPVQLADYRALRTGGRDIRLTIGPWKHVDAAGLAESLRDAIDWFGVQLQGCSTDRTSRVRIFVGGSRRWRELDDWPPSSRAVHWHLQPGGGLDVNLAATSEPDRYRYDPADPTPTVGGTVLGRSGGPRDNRKIERRADVLVYTSSALARDVEVVGNVTANLYVRSSLEHADCFVRLCDVDRHGASHNICDGLVRLTPGEWHRGPDGVALVTVELWPAAHVFRRGHRIRVQVASGAHPRFARNLGGAEPFGSATTMRVADVEIWHDHDHPSAIILPVWEGAG